jgi:hypothetical protein
MKQAIFSNWNFMRFLRLVLGVIIIIQAVIAKEWAIVVLGVAFTAMPIFNVGCCGAGGCAPNSTNKSPENTKDITYEEVV